jgi:hypothetical protein
MLGLQAAPKEISGISSAEAVYGQPLILPGELPPVDEVAPTEFRDKLSSSSLPATCQPCSYAEVAAVPPVGQLLSTKVVYIKRGGSGPPLAPVYSGPYVVVQSGAKFFVVEVGGRLKTVSMDRLKPHTGPTQGPAGDPPCRGPPPKGPRGVSSASP